MVSWLQSDMMSMWIPRRVHEGSVRDLSAAAHIERLDPAQVHEGSVRDLSVANHIERLNPTQVHKGRVRDHEAPPHIHSVQLCTCIVSNMYEI